MLPSEIKLLLPPWLLRALPSMDHPYPTLDDKMELALKLAVSNVAEGTGGPFGAAVFDLNSHRPVSVGVNLVMHSGYAMAHAEVVALALAQRHVEQYDLSATDTPYQLVSSAEPCLMCLGTVHWSGVQSLVISARDADVRAIGFDEGDKPPDWMTLFEARGMEIHRDIRRAEGIDVLKTYAAQGGIIYNADGP